MALMKNKTIVSSKYLLELSEQTVALNSYPFQLPLPFHPNTQETAPNVQLQTRVQHKTTSIAQVTPYKNHYTQKI
jgi:hypothetical protein